MEPARADAAADTGDVIELLRGRGLRMTPQRRAIVAEVMRTDGHISPPRWRARCRATCPA